MKRIVSIFLILCVIMSLMALAPLNASAESGEFTSGIYTYYISNGEATITECAQTVSGAIIIPSTLGGYPVTIIGDDAFLDCNSLTSIEIPDSITNIGSGAFFDCRSLTSIEIPDSITNIGNRAFYGCSSLTRIIIPDGIDNIGNEAFEGCDYLDVYYCGTTEEWNKYGVELSIIRCMGDYVSSGICGESVTWSYDKYGTLSIDGNGEMYDYKKMDDEAAALDPSFETYIPWNGYPILTYRIGKYVSKIDPHALYWCENIYVDGNNLNYCDIDGVLYSKNRETIVKYPTARRVTKVEIPYGVKNIGDFAFEVMDQVNEFVISDTVEHIGDKAFAFCRFSNILLPIRLKTIGRLAFYMCDRLTSIEMPDSLTRIGDLAFCYCDGLTDVYYTGSEDDWNNISIGKKMNL